MDRDAAIGLDHFGADVAQQLIKRGVGFGAGTDEFDFAAGERGGDGVGAGFDAVRHHGIFAATQALNAVDDDLGRAKPRDLGAHRDQEAAEVFSLRFARRVLEDRAPLRQRRGGEQIFGGADRSARHGEGRAFEALAGTGDDIAVFEIDAGAHRLETLDVKIDRAGADGAAAGQRNLRFAMTREQRPQHLEAGAHFADDIVGRQRGFDLGDMQAHRVALPQRGAASDVHADAELHQQIAHPADVGEARHVAQRHRLVGQQRRGHQFQRRILGAADGNFTLEAVAAPYPDSVHFPSRRPYRFAGRPCTFL